MSSTSQNNDNQEIDLSQIYKKIGSYFEEINNKIFRTILFFKRKFLILSILTAIGFGLGQFLDIIFKSYKNQIIVSPIGGGVDYLYSKIELLDSKLGEKDSMFFKSIGIKNFKKIKLIRVEPVIDIYNFVNNSTSAANAQNTQNFELVKLFAENSDINKVINDKLTSKNYPFHSIIITTKEQITEDEIIKPLLKYLNTDEYLNKISTISIENIKNKMDKNEQEIKQLDSLISQISKSIGKNERSSNLVYNSENNQIGGLFDLKNNLINEIASQKIQLVKIESFIRDISITTNIKNSKGTNDKLKFILPILFIFMFLFVILFKRFYSKQLAKSKI
jgi:hypothetical protein